MDVRTIFGLHIENVYLLYLQLKNYDNVLNKYGVKFLVSAKGKTGKELLEVLLARSNNSPEKELQNAREALWQITEKRAREEPADTLLKKLEEVIDLLS